MNTTKSAGIKQNFEIHQRRDGEPTLNARWPLGNAYPATGLLITNEEIKLDADPDVQRQKGDLKPEEDALGAVGSGSTEGLLHSTISVMHLPLARVMPS